MRYEFLALIALVPAAAGCGGDTKPTPDVTGERLDVAERRLDDRGLAYEVSGGGALGVVVRSHWWVCKQRPGPGRSTESVELVVARSCARDAGGTIPDVTGLRLDEAERELEEDGLGFEVYEEGLGEVVVKSVWTVCSQYPEPGENATEVELYVERFCDDDD